MAYKEIVTKAIIGKGKKTYKNTYQITVDEIPTTILGCWIINHNFEAKEIGDKIQINGYFDANVWYSYDNDTKTTVISKRINYSENEKVFVDENNVTGKEIIVRSLKQPICISAKEEGHNINLEIEKELGIEIVGDTKVRISSIDEDEDNWNDLVSADQEEKAIDKINPNYINEEIIKK